MILLLLGMLLVAWLTLQSMTAHQSGQKPALAPIDRAYDARRQVEQGNQNQKDLLDRTAPE